VIFKLVAIMLSRLFSREAYIDKFDCDRTQKVVVLG